MPRKARLVLDNCPHHVIQRGHNRECVFCDDMHFHYYLENLAEWKIGLGCRVYSFCLMTTLDHRPGGQPG